MPRNASSHGQQNWFYTKVKIPVPLLDIFLPPFCYSTTWKHPDVCVQYDAASITNITISLWQLLLKATFPKTGRNESSWDTTSNFSFNITNNNIIFLSITWLGKYVTVHFKTFWPSCKAIQKGLFTGSQRNTSSIRHVSMLLIQQGAESLLYALKFMGLGF